MHRCNYVQTPYLRSHLNYDHQEGSHRCSPVFLKTVKASRSSPPIPASSLLTGPLPTALGSSTVRQYKLQCFLSIQATYCSSLDIHFSMNHQKMCVYIVLPSITTNFYLSFRKNSTSSSPSSNPSELASTSNSSTIHGQRKLLKVG